MLPELKKAIMRFVPDYFSWDKKRQEQYRVDTPEEDAFKIMQFLLRELFDISVYAFKIMQFLLRELFDISVYGQGDFETHSFQNFHALLPCR